MRFDFSAFWRSFGYAFEGLAVLFRTQRNARVQLAALVLGVICGFLAELSREEWLALVLIATCVLSLEAVNTAIEAVVDLVSPEWHPLAKRAKDVAAGAVLLAAIGAIVVGALLFVPRLISESGRLFPLKNSAGFVEQDSR